MAVSQKQIAERLGVPIAQGSRTIGVVVYDFQDPFFGAIIEKLQEQAHEKNYSLVLAGFKGRLPEESDLTPLHEHAIDGLIILGSDEEAEWLKGFPEFPVVRIGHKDPAEQSLRVALDEDDAAEQLVQYLSRAGRKKLVFIGEYFPAHRLRFRALQKAAALFGCELRGIMSLLGPFDAGQDGARSVLERNNADALVCATDTIAMGVLHALHDAGSELPVTGFDDIPAAAQFIPPITTLCQPIEEMAREAFMAVIEPAVSGDKLLKGALIIRSSS